MSKLIVVFGATGKQGGSVLSALLADPSTRSTFRLRGVTRDTSKPAARALAAKGVEMVPGDLDDKASVAKAVEGAYGVFAVTDYWATMDGPREIQQGKNMVDASKAAGVQHFVLSTLMSPKKFTNGDLSLIEHFDGKAEVADYATASGLPTTFYLPGHYMSNLPNDLLRKTDTGKWVYAMPIEPDAQVPLIDIEADTGKYVKAIFTKRDQLLGKQVLGCGRYYSPVEIVETFRRVFPKDGGSAEYVQIAPEAFTGAVLATGMPEKGAVEMTENIVLLNRRYGYYNNADLTESNKILDEPTVTWEEYIKTAPAFKGLQ